MERSGTAMIERTIGFIGGGTMGSALLRGLLDGGVAAGERLFAGEPDPGRREALAELIGANAGSDNAALAEAVEVIVLSVKPNLVPAVAGDVRELITPEHLVVSIAAGVPIARLVELLGTERVIRSMPNTPALVGEGASAYCLGPGATEADAALVEEMLGSVGRCVRVEEKHMDAVTGLSGSGPAYVYLAIEALSDGGVKMGLPRDIAMMLAAQTVLGAARMVLETGEHPGRLKDQVATPGGTTIEGIHALEEAGLRRAFINAVVAATRRSEALGK
jgi:pyrroline-5-carboxylate reductase